LWLRLDRDIPYPLEQVRSVTLLFEGGRLWLEITAELPVATYPEGEGPDPGRIAGVDLGIIHPYTVAGRDGQALLLRSASWSTDATPSWGGCSGPPTAADHRSAVVRSSQRCPHRGAPPYLTQVGTSAHPHGRRDSKLGGGSGTMAARGRPQAGIRHLVSDRSAMVFVGSRYSTFANGIGREFGNSGSPGVQTEFFPYVDRHQRRRRYVLGILRFRDRMGPRIRC
jgi:hypothetical protein